MKLHLTVFAAALLGIGTLGAARLTGQARAEGASTGAQATVALHVEGMTCPSCKAAVRTALKKLDGVKDARVDVARKSASVDYDPARVTPRQLAEAVSRLGYQASLPATTAP